MEIQMKWFYRIGFLLLLFGMIFIFLKLQQLWLPVLRIMITVFIPFIIAAFISYLLHPTIERLHGAGLHRGLAVIIIYLIFFGGIGYGLYKGIPAIIHQLKDLSENIPVLADQYRDMVDEIQKKTNQWPEGARERIDDGILAVEEKLNQFLEKVLTGFVELINSIVVFAIIPFIAFYMLKDYHLMKKALWYITPRKWRKQGVLFLRDVDATLGNYIRGQLLVCLVVGAISAVLFWVTDMRYPLLLGFIIGVTNVIPYFGPIIGAIPAVIIGATVSVKMVIVSLIIIFVLQFLEGNILSPFIVGKSLHMHPILIMFALLVGGEIGGILGLIIAVPILSIIKVAIIHGKEHIMKYRENISTLPKH
ncbi:AI-2E family transporter [Bacillus marasmi]|uniref:AI-2E family transporter n=1 Tax=Bacillus marasmi TaxID=1926279 RepID=UPI0011C7EAE1|nr:AI-2E family transporter [Bacillus marasmi]